MVEVLELWRAFHRPWLPKWWVLSSMPGQESAL